MPVGAPAQVAVAGIAHDRASANWLEPARPVEARGTLVGDRFIVDKAILARRADGLFVQTFGIEVAALQAGDLGADQRGAVLEILRAILRPDLELLVMRSDSV